MSAWLLIVIINITPWVQTAIPGIESEAECHRLASELNKQLTSPRAGRHQCIEYFIAGKP